LKNGAQKMITLTIKTKLNSRVYSKIFQTIDEVKHEADLLIEFPTIENVKVKDNDNVIYEREKFPSGKILKVGG
jgi:hypothetical protein